MHGNNTYIFGKNLNKLEEFCYLTHNLFQDISKAFSFIFMNIICSNYILLCYLV